MCAAFIAEKLGVTQPTTSRHMKVLLNAGLVRAKSQKGWTFYRLDPDGMARARDVMAARLGTAGDPSAGGG